MSKELTKAKAKAPATMDTEVFDTRRVVRKLEDMMDGVTREKMTPDTVNAACNAADKIVDILRLHLDVERLRSKRVTVG